MHRMLGGILKNMDCPPFEINGPKDHVHLLFILGRVPGIAEVVKELKRQSTAWVKTKYPAQKLFVWQNGYGAFSVCLSQESVVRKYIAEQEEHHRHVNF
jgi:putative transposase